MHHTAACPCAPTSSTRPCACSSGASSCPTPPPCSQAFDVAVRDGLPASGGYNLYAILCLAENAVGPLATRPDDIHTLYRHAKPSQAMPCPAPKRHPHAVHAPGRGYAWQGILALAHNHGMHHTMRQAPRACTARSRMPAARAHGAWGMGHGAWGMGHGAWGMALYPRTLLASGGPTPNPLPVNVLTQSLIKSLPLTPCQDLTKIWPGPCHGIPVCLAGAPMYAWQRHDMPMTSWHACPWVALAVARRWRLTTPTLRAG